MKPFLCILSISMFLGCSHWVVDSETRLQIDNRSPWAVRQLRLVGTAVPDEMWIEDSIAPGAKSLVKTKSWVGSFQWVIDVRDSSCGEAWCSKDLGERSISGGSLLWLLKSQDGTLIIESK